jgi:hypothetical protein
VSVPLAITEAAVAAACPTRAVSNTAGVEANLAPDRARFGDLPVTATIQRDLVLVTALARSSTPPRMNRAGGQRA